MATLDDALAALGDSTDAIADTQSKPSYAMPKVQAKAAPTLDDALTALDGDPNEPLRDAVNLGTQRDPARSTKILQLFGKTGLPRDFIERNQDFVQQESDRQDFNPDKLMKDSPAFVSWLSEHPDHVSAAKPDVQALSLIEKQLRNIPAQFEQGKRTVEYGNVMLGIVDGLLGKTDVTALRKRQAELETAMGRPDPTGLADETGISGVLQRTPGHIAQQLPILGRTLQDQAKSGATGVAGGALLGGAVGGLPGAATGGLLVGGAMWRIGAAVSAAKMEMGHAFGDYEKLKDDNGQPLDQNTAMGLAAVVGVVNGAVEGFFGIEGLTSKLPGINQFTRQGVKELLKTPTTRAALLSAARTIGQTMVTEGATEALQMYITKAGGVALQAVKDGGSPADWLGKIFNEENLKQALTEAEAGAMGGGGIAAVMTSPQIASDIAKVKEANRAKAAFESIGKATDGAKFAQDLPDSLKDIISRATKDGPIEQVYVPSEAFDTYFQKEGVDPREVYKEITGNVEAYDQAAQTGADLPIQTADYVKNLAGTRHNEFFAKELRADLDAMNAREAEQWVKDQDAQAEAEAAAIAQPGIQTLNTADPAAEVRKDIAGQLQAAGFDPTVVDQYAGLFESRYRARAERRGLGETAADLFRQNNLSITNAQQPEAGALGQTFMQGGLQRPLYSMSPDELQAGMEAKREAVKSMEKEILGDRLEEFKRLERQVESYSLERDNPEKYKQVTDRHNEILDSLTEAQQDRLYGKGETDPQVDDYKEFIKSIGNVYGETPQELGQSIARAITEVGEGTDPSTMSKSEQVAFAQIRHAFDEAKRLGLNLKEVSEAAIRASAGRFSDPADAEFMLKRFIKQQVFTKEPTIQKRASSPQQGGPLYQSDGSPKGSITFGDGQISIKLLEQADLSTFIHETGHLYLNELITDATVAKKLTTDQLPEYARNVLAGDDKLRAANKQPAENLIASDWEHVTVPIESLRAANPFRFRDAVAVDKTKPSKSQTVGPILVDREGKIIDGNHRATDAIARGATTIEIYRPVQATSQQLRDDLDTILAWMKLDVRVADGADAVKGAIKTKHHEQFARGFEAYTMEGKSPSQAMREAFATFRQWLIQAYRSLTTAPLNVKLTKDVREVLDRMIATDTEIDAAAQEAEVHPMFTDAESAGMTPTQFNAYRETVAEASLSAREGLQLKLMKQLKRQDQKWWEEQRASKVEAITAQVNDRNEYVALAVLQTGKFPDGSDLADGIQPMKLDKKALKAQFGEEFVKTLPKGISAKDGMHPDAAAPIFGYSSGTELVEAMVNARPKNELIQAEADRQMIEQYGDMRFDGSIAEEAKAAVLNDQREAVIQAELRALKSKAREEAPFVKAAQTEAEAQDKVGRDLLMKGLPTLKDTRELARKILSRAALKTIKPNEYIVTARQASRNATKALAKKEYLDALKFKERELLNLALYREANIIRDQVDSARELAKDFFQADATLAKSRNVDLVNIGRAILAQHGLGNTTEKTAAEYLAPIQNYDIDLYNQWKQVVDALAPRQLDYRALTVDEFTRLHEDMKALWLLSRRVQQAKIDGQLVDRQQMIDELSAVMAGFTPTQIKDVAGPQSGWSDTKMALLSWQSALRRVESWVDAMDAGAINGPFRRYIWHPISEAADVFVEKKVTLLTQYHELLKPIQGTITKDLIAADELKPGFHFNGRIALLHALLHSGNESNFDKFIRGYKLNGTQWQAFIDRMIAEGKITKADYDYAQGVWDLLESLKPDTQKAHHEMYGFYFNEITAKPIQTPWGEYKGGYVPAKIDPAKSASQDIRDEKNLFDQGGNSFNFPTTGRGATRTRIQQVAEPLALDLTTIPIHLDWAMRFTYLEPRIKDVARLITNKSLRASLDAMNSTAGKDMLVPWLQRSAQQTVSTPGRNKHADRLWKYLRKTSGAQIMVGNVLNTLQQLTGFSQSLLKVKAKHMRGAMVNYLRHPVQYADDIVSRSLFMKNRTMTQVMEVQSSIDDIMLNPTKYEKAKKFAERHGYFMQQGTQSLVDLVTWGAAYDQAHAQGLDEKMAVRSADSAVRETQGSFAPQDISNFEAGTPFTRAFTMFYSYFNMQANLLGTEFSKVAQDMGLRKGAGRAFYIYLVGFMIPAIVAETIVKGMGGFDPDDDDDYLNEVLSVTFGSQFRSALAFFPGVGPATLAGINMFNDKWYDDRISTSPALSMIESAVRVPHDLYKVMSDDGHSKRAVKDVLTLIGLVTGLPAGSLARPLGYLADVADDKAWPEDAGDVARGLLSGKDVNRTK